MRKAGFSRPELKLVLKVEGATAEQGCLGLSKKSSIGIKVSHCFHMKNGPVAK